MVGRCDSFSFVLSHPFQKSVPALIFIISWSLDFKEDSPPARHKQSPLGVLLPFSYAAALITTWRSTLPFPRPRGIKSLPRTQGLYSQPAAHIYIILYVIVHIYVIIYDIVYKQYEIDLS